MSRHTAATSTIQGTETSQTLRVAMELGETGWLLGFASEYGQKPLRRRVDSRDGAAVLEQIAWAKGKLGLAEDAPVASCYEAGRDGFWLHRFLVAHGIDNLVVDSASIEVNRRKRRAKSDRIDLIALLDLLARHRAGSVKPVWSVVHVPSEEDEDRRHLGRELRLLKKDRTRTSNRIKGLLANHGLPLELRGDLREQIASLRRWDGEALPPGLRARLDHYVEDYRYLTERIRGLEAERRRMLREEEAPVLDQVRQLCSLRAVGIETAWTCATEFFAWRQFDNGKQVGGAAGLTPTPYDSGKTQREQGIGKAGSRGRPAIFTRRGPSPRPSEGVARPEASPQRQAYKGSGLRCQAIGTDRRSSRDRSRTLPRSRQELTEPEVRRETHSNRQLIGG